jgi:FkbM family methyltransferase
MNQCYDFHTDSEKPVIYDCGANIGTSVLFFAQKYPNAIIKAFEPSPSVFEILKSNIQKNKINNVELYQNAVWINNEELSFNDEGSDNGSISAVARANTIKVQALDFLEIINKEEKIDLIKIDIEGAESILLPRMKPAFSKIEKIFIEYHSFNNEEQKLGELLLLLTQNHFRFYIRNENNRKKPFINLARDKEMDMQLNIFAYKM